MEFDAGACVAIFSELLPVASLLHTIFSAGIAILVVTVAFVMCRDDGAGGCRGYDDDLFLLY